MLVKLRRTADKPQTPCFIVALGSAGQQIDLMVHKINRRRGAYAAFPAVYEPSATSSVNLPPLIRSVAVSRV